MPDDPNSSVVRRSRRTPEQQEMGKLSLWAVLLSPFEPVQNRTDVGAVPLVGVAGWPALFV